MEINYLYSIAEKENVEIFDYPLTNNLHGIYIDKTKTIGIDEKLTEIEKKCILAEELGHYYCDATYDFYHPDKALIDKAEYRAKKWSIKALVSPSDIEKVKELGLQYKWEIAEFLGVTESVAEKAIEYYKSH